MAWKAVLDLVVTRRHACGIPSASSSPAGRIGATARGSAPPAGPARRLQILDVRPALWPARRSGGLMPALSRRRQQDMNHRPERVAQAQAGASNAALQEQLGD